MTDKNVRIAHHRDMDELVNLVRVFHSEEGLAPLSEDCVVNTIRSSLDGNAVIGVIGPPGRIESSMHLVLGKLWYTSDRSLESLWSFTLPEYRRSSNTKSLIQFSKRQAHRIGCPLLLDVVCTDDNEPKIRLFERELGARSGAVFHYQPLSKEDKAISFQKVRMADLSDEEEILDIGRELHRENGSFNKDEEFAIAAIRQALAGDGVIGVVGEKGNAQATIYLQIARLWYSESPLVEERFLFVKPEYRATKNARNLIRFARMQADKINVPLRIGIVSRIETERKIDLYRRLLGKESGAFFLWNPNQDALQSISNKQEYVL